MDNIIWKTLIYHNEKYDRFEVSNTGLIRNSYTKRIYKTAVINGYVQICVSLGSAQKKKVFKIHRAVAETFIPNPENKSDVNHKDGNKQNNDISNLEWATRQENIQHAFATGLSKPICGSDNTTSKLTDEDVKYIRTHYIPYDNQYGTRALGRKFNVNHETIRDVIHGNTYQNAV